MLPTPAKFHYVFNLRDLSRIWQGMVSTISSVITDEKVLLSLWKHECSRVLADRFVDVKDTIAFTKTFARVVEDDISPDYTEYMKLNSNFCSFLRDAPEATGDEPEDTDFSVPSIYEPVSEHKINFKKI